MMLHSIFSFTMTLLIIQSFLFLGSSFSLSNSILNNHKLVQLHADTSVRKWLSAGLIVSTLQLSGSTILGVQPAYAALPKLDGVSIQPDAIEKRRVMEQPTGAPEAEDKKAKVTRLPSGVEYFDVKVGEGPSAEEGRTVQFQWVLRRSNGYFVDASSNYNNEVNLFLFLIQQVSPFWSKFCLLLDHNVALILFCSFVQPFIYKVGNTKKVIKGVDEGIRGMKVGGVRRMNIPPNAAFTEGVGDGKPGPMPEGFGPRRQILTRIDREVWYYEIQLIKVTVR